MQNNDQYNKFSLSELGSKNFFIESENSNYNNAAPVSKRLNDYDYNILKDEAYKDVRDECFKLEYKISRLEDDLKNIDQQIQSARDISDYDSVEYFINRKKQLQIDLQNLIDIYNDKSLSSKISGGLFNVLSPKFKDNLNSLHNYINNIKELIVSSLPRRFSSVLEIKQSLNKLENISKNVDELMRLETPYGESSSKYEQLSKYIVRANTIHSQIAKSLK